MSFFELPPPPPEDEKPERPQSMLGPPDNVLGVGVPVRLVLARTDEIAVLITKSQRTDRLHPHDLIASTHAR